jgi:hypothetical protein
MQGWVLHDRLGHKLSTISSSSSISQLGQAEFCPTLGQTPLNWAKSSIMFSRVYFFLALLEYIFHKYTLRETISMYGPDHKAPTILVP